MEPGHWFLSLYNDDGDPHEVSFIAVIARASVFWVIASAILVSVAKTAARASVLFFAVKEVSEKLSGEKYLDQKLIDSCFNCVNIGFTIISIYFCIRIYVHTYICIYMHMHTRTYYYMKLLL